MIEKYHIDPTTLIPSRIIEKERRGGAKSTKGSLVFRWFRHEGKVVRYPYCREQPVRTRIGRQCSCCWAIKHERESLQG